MKAAEPSATSPSQRGAPSPTPSHTEAHADPVGLLCGFGAALIWGAWPVVSKLGLRDNLAATDIAALRFAVAGVLLLPFFKQSAREVSSWGLVLLMTLGAGVPYILFGIGGMSWQSVTHAAVISPSCSLMASAIGASLLLGEPTDVRRWIAVLMLGAGVVLVGGEGWAGTSSPHPQGWIGDLMFCASGCLWAVFTLSARKAGLAAINAASLVAVFSALFYLPLYFAFLPHALGVVPWPVLARQALFQGVLAAVVGLYLYAIAIARLGAGRAALFIGLVPAIAMLLSWLVLGERPGAAALGGLVLATAGMRIALARPDRLKKC